MAVVVITIQRYVRRGSRTAALAPITAFDPKYAIRRAAQMTSGDRGAIVLAEGTNERGEVIEAAELARYGTTPVVR
jgi:hypothetical protein